MIYISGPIMGTDDYMERFENAEKELTSYGYDVVNPAHYKMHLLQNIAYEQYMRMSLALIESCSGIYMLDGWENSLDAKRERAYAEGIGIEIMYQTPPSNKEQEVLYYWKLRGNFNERCYLNVYNGRKLGIDTKLSDDECKTQFSESEYKTLAKKYHFSEDMFVKVEIE